MQNVRTYEGVPLLSIHGFTGSSKSWDTIKKSINAPLLSIDIPGHAKSKFNNFDDTYNCDDFVNDLYLMLNKLKLSKINLLGYSMGGRLALSFACRYPKMISHLLLESTTLGIDNIENRDDRYEKDKELSITIEKSLNEFVSNWSCNNLFNNQRKRNQSGFIEQEDIRLNHNKYQLSKSLKSFSVGNMNYLGSEYQSLKMPITLINGKEDTKYIKESRNMLLLNKNAKQYIVNDACHNTHLENDTEFIYILNNVLL